MPAPRPSSGTQRTHLPLGCSMLMRSKTTRMMSGSKWRVEGGRERREEERRGERGGGGREEGEREGEKEAGSREVEGGRRMKN